MAIFVAGDRAAAKKKKDFSKVEFLNYEEGLCVQCMHIGPYDDVSAAITKSTCQTRAVRHRKS